MPLTFINHRIYSRKHHRKTLLRQKEAQNSTTETKRIKNRRGKDANPKQEILQKAAPPLEVQTS